MNFLIIDYRDHSNEIVLWCIERISSGALK